MAARVYFKEMINKLTEGFSAERTVEQENYRELLNGGYNYSMRARTIR